VSESERKEGRKEKTRRGEERGGLNASHFPSIRSEHYVSAAGILPKYVRNRGGI
jgi:hypothetical protein